MKNRFKKIICAGITLLFLYGCGHKAYMGIHGKSIKSSLEVHDTVIQDSQCLECHHSDKSEVPATPHPNFKVCIKCHND